MRLGDQCCRLRGGRGRGGARLRHVHRALAAASEEDAGHGQFHRSQFRVDLEQEAVCTHRAAVHADQVADVVRHYPGGEDDEIRRHLDLEAAGQKVAGPDDERRVPPRVGLDRGRVPGIEPEEEDAGLRGALVVGLVAATIGPDVLVEIGNDGVGVLSLDLERGVEGISIAVKRVTRRASSWMAEGRP